MSMGVTPCRRRSSQRRARKGPSPPNAEARCASPPRWAKVTTAFSADPPGTVSLASALTLASGAGKSSTRAGHVDHRAPDEERAAHAAATRGSSTPSSYRGAVLVGATARIGARCPAVRAGSCPGASGGMRETSPRVSGGTQARGTGRCLPARTGPRQCRRSRRPVHRDIDRGSITWKRSRASG